jgi:glycosyltransferase involved in cell wall biosynthesis
MSISHSIIIPHRNRVPNLNVCLDSIIQSADYCGVSDYEIIVVNDGPDDPGFKPLQSVLYALPPDRNFGPFNKPRLQGIGILMARGAILTFLDADALVPRRFMENATRLSNNPSLTKLCYRVRKIPQSDDVKALDKTGPIDLKDPESLFARYDLFQRAMEAYKKPHTGYLSARQERKCLTDKEPVFGNSQFSIPRNKLLPVLPDRRFDCRGFEDIYFNLQIWAWNYADYRAEMVTDSEHALLHLPNPTDNKDQWGGINGGANESLYRVQWHTFSHLARKKRYEELKHFALGENP